MSAAGFSPPHHQEGPAAPAFQRCQPRGAGWPLLRVALLLVGPPLSAQQPEPPPGPPSAEAGPRTVRVKAEGYNRDDALRQALRRALEQGAGVQIAAHSQTEHFVLVRDTIYSRAAGIVSEYRVLNESAGAGGTFEIEIEATVRPDAVARAWSEVQNVLDQIGRPRIMIWIEETIDGEPQSDSIVASRLEQMFGRCGFDLVEKRAVEEIARREHESALREQSAARLAALAKDAGAHVLIRGSANANRAGLETLYGQIPVAFYNCDVQAKVYYTDTGRLLASESLPSTRAGVRSQKEFSPQAARSALVQATFPDTPVAGAPPPLSVRLYRAVLEHWADQISFAADLLLEVESLNFKTYVALRRALTEIDPQRIRSVEGDFTRGIGRFRIQAQMSAATLAERLTDKPFSEWIEVLDLKLNRIQARAVSPP